MRQTKYDNCDPYTVEQLVKAIGLSLERAVDPELTTPAEVISALFTTLDRTLRSMKDHQRPEDVFSNTKEIARVLNEMITEFGMTLH